MWRFSEPSSRLTPIPSTASQPSANPGFVSSYNNLALAYEGAGRVEEAIEVWQAVLGWSVQRGDAGRIERAKRHLRDLGVEPPDARAAP